MTSAQTNDARIRDMVHAGDYAGADAACHALLGQGEDAGVHHLLGYSALNSGRYEAAADGFSTAAGLGLKEWSNDYFLGRCLSILGRPEEALAAFASAYALAPGNADAATARIDATLERHGLEAATRLYASMAADVSDSVFHRHWAEIRDGFMPPEILAAWSAGRLDEAEGQIRSMLKAHRTRALYMLGRYMSRYRQWLAYTQRPEAGPPGRKRKVSIMLITYNHEKFIGRALEGVLAQQTEFDYEINVVEDCSTDKTRDVIMEYKRKYPDRINLYFNPTNIGTLDPPAQKVTYAACKNLTGDYISILEGDDYWDSPDKLQKQVTFLEANPAFAACAHNTIKIYEDGSVPPHRFIFHDAIKPASSIDDAVNMSMFFHTSSIIYRNVLMAKPPRGFRSKWSCDIFNTMAHIQYGLMGYLNEDMSVYRAHSGGVYSTMAPVKGRLFNIGGLQRYNMWLGFRFMKGFAFTLHRLCAALLADCATGKLTPLSERDEKRYRRLGALYGSIYDLIDRHPGLDPAVWLYGEPRKLSHPRAERMADQV